MQTDRTQITTHRIKLKTLHEPVGLMAYFRIYGIKYYVYEIRHLGYILKYGMSAGEPGERLYRQIANAPLGWSKDFRSPSGKDFEYVCKDFATQFGIVIDRNNLEVVIHDMTNYKSEYSFNPLLEVKRFEAELIRDFTVLHGEQPIGNLKTESQALDILATPDSVMNKFFDIA